MTRTRVRCLEASARQLPSWADSTCLRLLAWVRYPEAARSMIAWASGCVGHHHPRCRIRASGGQQELQTTGFFSLMAVTQSRAGKGMGPSPLLAQGHRSHTLSLEIGGSTASYETTSSEWRCDDISNRCGEHVDGISLSTLDVASD